MTKTELSYYLWQRVQKDIKDDGVSQKEFEQRLDSIRKDLEGAYDRGDYSYIRNLPTTEAVSDYDEDIEIAHDLMSE